MELASSPVVVHFEGVAKGNSVMTPAGVIRPILLPLFSVNQRLPSGPAVIPARRLSGVGIGYSVIDGAACADWAARPMSIAPTSSTIGIARPRKP
jgi:hypothetical protein